ncbi:ribonuclease H-like domain protein [Vibrio phage 1.244.A._10N.261.54.C3]|nr:ribonuclease H-like domain protein [Vibrio phage 1.244.A._10N.261.54.C3]AUR98693.1 ribonuclease H-like domain protein [Vibrio phage 1.255.O._10N.286.45.F1]
MSQPKIYAGIDYSMTSPAIAVWDSSTPFRFENIRFYNYYSVKKYEGVFGKHGNVCVMMQQPYENNEERFRRLSLWCKAVLMQEKVTHAALEDYAMGAKGAVFHIGENTGVLKQVLHQLKIPFVTPKPTEVKKIFCGKGNGKKDDMINAFNSLFNVQMHEIIGAPKLDSKPVDDIVDGLAVLSSHPDMADIHIGDDML